MWLVWPRSRDAADSLEPSLSSLNKEIDAKVVLRS